MLFKGFRHIRSLVCVKLSVHFCLCRHTSHSLVCKTFNCACHIDTPLSAVIPKPAFVCITVSHLLTEKVNKAFCVACIVK